jgi:hypothetical protein
MFSLPHFGNHLQIFPDRKFFPTGSLKNGIWIVEGSAPTCWFRCVTTRLEAAFAEHGNFKVGKAAVAFLFVF